MAANPKSPVVPGSAGKPSHTYHAEAFIFEGILEHPIQQKIEPYGKVALESRRESLLTEHVGETNIEGLISFKSGHTRVIGTHVQHKTDIFGNNHAGWVTLSTAVLEGLNVVDILTVDRVVAQVSTEHADNGPIPGHVPDVTFLGTRFENLRIGGVPVQVELDLSICGNKPANDRPYLESASFLDNVERQYETIAKTRDLPDGIEKKCGAEIAYIDDLRKRAKSSKGRGAESGRNGYAKLQCSIVKTIAPIPIPGVRTFGSMIFIPNFGTVALGELEVGTKAAHGVHSEGPRDASLPEPTSNYFTLNMVSMKLGCPTGGSGKGGGVNGNGTTNP